MFTHLLLPGERHEQTTCVQFWCDDAENIEGTVTFKSLNVNPNSYQNCAFRKSRIYLSTKRIYRDFSISVKINQCKEIYLFRFSDIVFVLP